MAWFAVGSVVGRVIQLALDSEVRDPLDEAYQGFLDTYKGYARSPGRVVRLTLRVPFGG